MTELIIGSLVFAAVVFAGVVLTFRAREVIHADASEGFVLVPVTAVGTYLHHTPACVVNQLALDERRGVLDDRCSCGLMDMMYGVKGTR